MFRLFLLSIFVSLSRQQGCITRTFIDNSLDPYPKPGAFCTSPEAENRWRGELIYEYLEDSNGIRVKWKHILQRPDCNSVNLNLFVDNVFFSAVTHYNHRNVDWVEIRAEKTFELKIQAIYRMDPKCFEASKTINIDNREETTTIVEKPTEDSITKDKANTTSATIDNFFTKDDYKNTIIISLSSLLVIIIIVFTVIAIVVWRRIREGIMKVDDNRDVYGTYYGGEVEYSEVQDSNPYYGS